MNRAAHRAAADSNMRGQVSDNHLLRAIAHGVLALTAEPDEPRRTEAGDRLEKGKTIAARYATLYYTWDELDALASAVETVVIDAVQGRPSVAGTAALLNSLRTSLREAQYGIMRYWVERSRTEYGEVRVRVDHGGMPFYGVDVEQVEELARTGTALLPRSQLTLRRIGGPGVHERQSYALHCVVWDNTTPRPVRLDD